MLQDLTKSGSCLILRRKRVLSTWKTFSSPRKFTDLSLPGSSKGSFAGGF
ncbi:CEL_1a_G0023180.mRNA.1.CDS.1 [Saccharomyces cerevisiae]|nr:CEL_1a_G0023180.mRNA.1.CDS.1 [Saccharomyces cerevisiae]CAI7324041.1 CEL_1a_G0023180.mRNA.1.CDS.1 [Saccharomyces cerevisiae]